MFAGAEAANPFVIPADEDLFRLQVSWKQHVRRAVCSLNNGIDTAHHKRQQAVHDLQCASSKDRGDAS